MGGAALAAACSSTSSEPAAVSDAGSDTAAAATKANGSVGAFSNGPAMPKPRANHCAVATNGFLVVVGGNYKDTAKNAFVSLDEIDAAPVAADGSLGDWKQIGTTPSPVISCTATANGSTIYLLDGIYDDTTVGGKVYSATIGADGMLSAFQSIGALPATSDVYSSTAWIDGPAGSETLSVFNSYLPSGPVDDAGFEITDDAGNPIITDAGALTILTTSLASLAWNETPFLPAFRGEPQLAYTQGFVYALGGYSGAADGGPPDLPEQVNVEARGSAGAHATTPLPKATMFGSAVAVDGYLFLFGGRDDIFSGTPRADVLSAPIASDGTLGAWTAQTPMPAPRTNGSVVTYGDFAYVTGGGNDGPGLDSVFYARVRF